MRRFFPLALIVALAGCPGAGGGLGDSCDGNGDCASNLQCLRSTCVGRCQRAPECGAGTTCASIPRVQASGAPFAGCLPSQGTIRWMIPIPGPAAEILLPVPDVARSATLVMRVDDVSQQVGAARVVTPSNVEVYRQSCAPPVSVTDPPCSET